MTPRFSVLCLFLFVFFTGCKEKAEVTESIASHGIYGDGILAVPESLPPPSEEMLAALGPLNDLDIRWLLSHPVYVTAGQPRRFLNSPLGKGNEHIVNSMLAQFLQTPLEYGNVERFIHGTNSPVEAIVDIQEKGVATPRRVLLNRRTTVLIHTEPIKPEEFVKRLLGTSRPFEEIPKRKVGDREYVDLTPPNLAVPQKLAVFFADDKTVVLVEGDEPAIHEALGDKSPQGAAIERLRRIDIANSDLVFVASREGVPFEAVEVQGMLQQNGVPLSLANAIALGWRAVNLTIDTQTGGEKPMLAAKLDTTTPKSAAEIAEIVLGLIITGQTTLASMDDAAKNMMPIPPDVALSLLNSLKVESVESRVDVMLAKFEGFDAVAAKGINDTQARIQEEQKFQQQTEQLAILTQAFASHFQKNKKFPATITSADGTPLLSWRVALLPIIGQDELYRKFKLDEPWDGPTNKPLLESMPLIFASDNPSLEKTKTVLRFFDSEGTPLADKELKAEDLKTPQTTLLFVKVVPDRAVEWTKPDPLEFDVQKIEETVGNVFFGITFVGQPTIVPIIPLSDPRSAFQRSYLTALVKGEPLPTPPPPVTSPQ